MWAILSGIEGNLAAYEAVIADIKPRNRYLEALYIIGDLVGPRRECEQLVAVTVTPRQVIGVGNVGRIPGQATYTLYNPGTNQVQFKTVFYGQSKGFQIHPQSKT